MSGGRSLDNLRKQLEDLPRTERLPFLAALPRDEQTAFKRLLSPEDRAALNAYIDAKRREAARPTVESWLEEARQGRATSVDAMVDVLTESISRLRETDAVWIRRITADCPGGHYSRRQEEVLRSIYRRYFRRED